MIEDFKVGDKVTIVPNSKHGKEVSSNYGKVLKVARVVNARTLSHEDVTLYKVGRIPNYATIDDLQPYKE